MEYSLIQNWNYKFNETVCLNPYSNGILSDKFWEQLQSNERCLNPYSNGILPDFFSTCLQPL